MTRISELGAFLNIKAHCLLGGCSIRDDVRICREGVQIIVGTPRCVQEMIDRRYLYIDHVRLLFLDGIDELLGRGFRDMIISIFGKIPEARQTLFSSSGDRRDARELLTSVMRNPLILKLSGDYADNAYFEDCSYVVAEDVDGAEETDSDFEKKFKALLSCLRVIRSRNIIICNDVETVHMLHERFQERGIHVVSLIHPHDEANILRFCDLWRSHSGDGIFILSDSGIYILHDNHRYGYVDIVNFDVPKTTVMMRYRNGSKGAFGRKYARITIVTRSEMPRLLELGMNLDIEIFQAPLDADYYA
jgi:superfamily II DNA/RNA helicase